MLASARFKRRLAVAALLSVIGLAFASMFRTTVERELLPPRTTYSLAAALSLRPAERQFYRLRGQQESVYAQADELRQRLEQRPTDEAERFRLRESQRQVREAFVKVAQAYEGFLEAHPNHLAARLACAGLLDRLGDEAGALRQREIALTLNPKDATLCNQLANDYTHAGQLSAAFLHYAKAIELAPRQSSYYFNFGTAVFLYRRDAMRFYQANEQQVFDRALELLRKAAELDPDNLALAAEVAMSYYSIKPLRVDAALAAWNNLYRSAQPGVQRQEVALHLARINLEAGRLEAARGHLAEVSHDAHQPAKARLVERLTEKDASSKPLQAVPATLETR